MNERTRGRLLVIGAALCWSFGGAAVKLAMAGMNGYQIAGFRSIFAMLFLSLLFRPWRARSWWPGYKVILIAVTYAIMLILFILANTKTTAATSIFLQDTAPAWVVLLSPVLLKESPQRSDFIVLLFCGLGMSLFFKGQLSFEQTTGNILALLSGVAYALVVLGLRWGQPKERSASSGKPALPDEDQPSDSELIVVWGNFFTILGCGYWMFDLPPMEKFWLPLGITAGMGVFQIGLGYYLLTKALRQVPAAEASLLALIEPITNPIWAFLVVGENPGRWALLGGAIVLGTLAGHALFTRRKIGREDPEPHSGNTRGQENPIAEGS